MGLITLACVGSVVPAALGAPPVGGGTYFALPAGAKPDSKQGGVVPVAAKLRVSPRAQSFAPTALTHECANGETVEVRVHGAVDR
jgi:hypothetical protein